MVKSIKFSNPFRRLDDGDAVKVRKLLNQTSPSFLSCVDILGLSPGESFKNTDLRGVNFGHTDLSEFDFSGADISDADLSNARGVSVEQIKNCAWNDGTKLNTEIERDFYKIEFSKISKEGKNIIDTNSKTIRETSNFISRALNNYIQAIANDSVEAMYNLGLMLEERPVLASVAKTTAAMDLRDALEPLKSGDTEPKDLGDPTTWYRRAAERGHVKAMTHLAALYQKGSGVEQNIQKAVDWYLKAAAIGDGEAMANLGRCYEHGIGVEQDAERALDWYRKGAVVAHGGAMANLGACYQRGIGVEQNVERALEWYRKGAAAGNGKAMASLGVLYARGDGVEQNMQTALDWHLRGASAGDNNARIALAVLSAIVPSSKHFPIKTDSFSLPDIRMPAKTEWTDIPLVDGDWVNIDSGQAEDLIGKLALSAAVEGQPHLFANQKITAIRQIPLICYPEFMLVDVQLSQGGSVDQRLLSALISRSGAILLDGNSQRFEILNLLALNLDTEAARVQYLKLFCAYVRGENGSYSIVSSLDEIQFENKKFALDRKKMGISIYPPSTINETTGKAKMYRIGAFIQSGVIFAKAEFSITADGQIKMLSNDSAMGFSKILMRTYDRYFRTPPMKRKEESSSHVNQTVLSNLVR